MVFSAVIYGCEIWTIKLNAEEMMLLNCGVEDLRVPWTARRSNQSILREINPEYSLKVLKLKLKYFGYLMRKDPDARKDWEQGEKGIRGWDGWMASLTRWTWVWASSRSWWWTGKPDMLQSTQSQKSWTQMSDWTELVHLSSCFSTELQYYTVICWLNLQDQNLIYSRPTLSYMYIFDCRGLVP